MQQWRMCFLILWCAAHFSLTWCVFIGTPLSLFSPFYPIIHKPESSKLSLENSEYVPPSQLGPSPTATVFSHPPPSYPLKPERRSQGDGAYNRVVENNYDCNFQAPLPSPPPPSLYSVAATHYPSSVQPGISSTATSMYSSSTISSAVPSDSHSLLGGAGATQKEEYVPLHMQDRVIGGLYAPIEY